MKVIIRGLTYLVLYILASSTWALAAGRSERQDTPTFRTVDLEVDGMRSLSEKTSETLCLVRERWETAA